MMEKSLRSDNMLSFNSILAFDWRVGEFFGPLFSPISPVYAEFRNARMSLNRKILRKFLLLIFAVSFFTVSLQTQSFRNLPGGVYKGSGLFQVKEEATGLPDTVTGTFEYYGNDQEIESKNFENLLLNGSGVKVTNSLTILRSVAIADGIRFKINSNMLLEKYNGRITNEAGVIIGKVSKQADLYATSDSSDFGGIGLSVKNQGDPLGETEVVRISGPDGSVKYGGSSSIQRLYELRATNTNNQSGTLYFRYSNDELGGQDSLTLDLWRSIDGVSWRRQHTSRGRNLLVRSGKFLSGYWTAADANNILGKPNYEFDPDSILAIGPDSLRGRVNSLLDSMFVAQITDIFGNPISNTKVRFSITEWPEGAYGQSLTDTLVMSDSDGKVATRMRLGNRAGRYRVTASVVSVPSTSISFVGYAGSSLSALRIESSPVSDTIKQVIGPLVVQAIDQDNYGVPNTGVRFSISPPEGSIATKQNIVTADTLTDVNGFARAMVQLGEKVGVYRVIARSTENDSIFAEFSILATHGIPALAWQRSAVEYSDTVGSILPKFVYAITDSDTNSVGGHNITFTIVSKPDGAVGDSLVNQSTVTDPVHGEASVALRLGGRIGQYIVKAEDPTVPNSARFFVGNGLPGRAVNLTYNGGRGQVKPILEVLDNPFEIRITDVNGNPVVGIPVSFMIVDTPSGSWGHSLLKMVDTTDFNGIASSSLRLGSKVGTYLVQATSPAVSYSFVPFEARATAGKATNIAQRSSNIQVGHILEPLRPFEVQVSDTGGNFVPNAEVRFEIVSHPIATQMDSLTSTVTYTDSNGVASTIMILGDKQGEYRIRASIPNGKDTTFIAYAVLLLADANHDNFRNIGDLTAIIDHILGRRILTGADFARADMAPVRDDGTVGDGRVDIRDALVCRDSLLMSGWDPAKDWMLYPEEFLHNIHGVIVPADSGKHLEESVEDSCYIQLTHIGSRILLKNTVPVKGLQVVIYTKNPVNLDTIDLVFPRAKMMNTEIRSRENQIRIVMWNTSNEPIQPGDSAILRLPVRIGNENVDSIHVVASITDTNSSVLLACANQDIRNLIPSEWKLYQNYPNPFNMSTAIEFDVPEVNGRIPRVAIQIFNILGQKVMTLDRGIYDAGRYSVRWNGMSENGGHVASGVYFYRLLAGDYAVTKKMVLVK